VKRIVPVLTAAVLLAGGSAFAQSAFKLTSTDVAEGAAIKAEQTFNGFGCSGANVSPALSWTGVPAGTKSLALIVHDPDAPTGVGGFTHWIVYNIPATATGLPKGAGSKGGTLPAGAMQAATSFGAPGYGGPCPPAGDKPHRYVFTLYALKTDKVDLPPDSTQALAGFTINGSKLATATLTALYGR
jgi:Raf kinase inhibitor-like YbhB/YbcL family protein